jgi:hypothetical protein
MRLEHSPFEENTSMEAGIQGFGKHGDLQHRSLADALIVQHSELHSVTKTTREGSGGARLGSKLSVDSYTNAHGVTQVSQNGKTALTTRDDVIHDQFSRIARSVSVRKGDTTNTHTDASSHAERTDHATITTAAGKTTADSEVTAKVKTETEKTADGTKTTRNVKSTSEGEAETEFHITQDGTITDARGKVITLHETGHGLTETTSKGSATSTSVTTADTDRIDKRTTQTTGETVTDTKSTTERDSTTKYEGVLSSTTANGKTTTRYIDYVVEDDVKVKATTHSVDDFTVTNAAATAKSGKAGNTVTQTVDAVSDSQTAIVSQRADQVHAADKPAHGKDAILVKTTDHVEAESQRDTTFQNSAHIVTDNGAVITTTDRTVHGETLSATETDATIHSTVQTQHDKNATVQTVNRTTDAHSETETQTVYDATSNTSASNGATSSRTDHVRTKTDYDVQRFTKYYAVIRTVITDAATSSFSAAA